MKFVLVPLLMMLMLIQTFSKWMVVLEYNLNKNYIAKNLCINSSRPKLHCNGKCQMMKKLAEEEKQNSTNNNNPQRVKIQEVVFSDALNKPSLPAIGFITVSYNEEPPLLKQPSPVDSIFHPPALG